MNNETDPLFLLYSIALAQLIVVIVGVVRKRKAGLKEVGLVIIFVFSLFLIIAEFLLMWSGYLTAVPWILGLSLPFQFLLAPVFIGMVFLTNKRDLRTAELLHLAPFFFLIIYQLVWLPSRVPDKLLYYEQSIVTEEAFSTSEYIFQVILWTLHLGLYLAFIRWSKKGFTLNKIQQVIFWVLSGVMVLLLIHAGLLFLGLPYYALTYCILIGLLGVLGFWMQVGILVPGNEDRNEKYKNSGLSSSIVSREKERVEEIITARQLYLQPDLTLSVLANTVGLSTHHLSQIINQGYGKSFSDYINEHRVNFSQGLLSTSGRTIEQIAYESGFNSRNSFHRAFKKSVKMNPSEYKAKSYKG